MNLVFIKTKLFFFTFIYHQFHWQLIKWSNNSNPSDWLQKVWGSCHLTLGRNETPLLGRGRTQQLSNSLHECISQAEYRGLVNMPSHFSRYFRKLTINYRTPVLNPKFTKNLVVLWTRCSCPWDEYHIIHKKFWTQKYFSQLASSTQHLTPKFLLPSCL